MMRTLLVVAILVTGSAVGARAQVVSELSYGADRNIASDASEMDGRLSASLEWRLSSGLGLGIGTDHQFEGAALVGSDHLGWAIYASSSFELPLRAVAPFVRAGLGLGPAPCVGDTCGDGAYLRGSAGLRVSLPGALGVFGEVGVSRVSRPFSVAGLSVRF